MNQGIDGMQLIAHSLGNGCQWRQFEWMAMVTVDPRNGLAASDGVAVAVYETACERCGRRLRVFAPGHVRPYIDPVSLSAHEARCPGAE